MFSSHISDCFPYWSNSFKMIRELLFSEESFTVLSCCLLLISTRRLSVMHIVRTGRRRKCCQFFLVHPSSHQMSQTPQPSSPHPKKIWGFGKFRDIWPPDHPRPAENMELQDFTSFGLGYKRWKICPNWPFAGVLVRRLCCKPVGYCLVELFSPLLRFWNFWVPFHVYFKIHARNDLWGLILKVLKFFQRPWDVCHENEERGHSLQHKKYNHLHLALQKGSVIPMQFIITTSS